MKTLIVGVLSFILFNTAKGQSLLANAMASAKTEHKMILLNFSGSDWCIPCIRMEKEYFSNESFKKMADSQLIIIHADFPRKKKNLPPPGIIKENEALAERFNKQGSFPLTILLDHDLKIIRTWEGLPEEGAQGFISVIESLVNKNK